METITLNSKNGHEVTSHASKNSHGIGGSTYIDDVFFTSFDTCDSDVSEKDCAEYEAQATADMLDAGHIRRAPQPGWDLSENCDELEENPVFARDSALTPDEQTS